MMQFSGKLVGRVAHDCGISQNEATERLMKVAEHWPRKVHKRSPRMSAWGIEWRSSDLEAVSGIPIKTLLSRWNKGVRYPDLIKRMLPGGKKTAEELEERAFMKEAEACDKLLKLLRKHHPELELAAGERFHTASGVINGARFRDAAFIGVHSSGHMEAI